MNDPKRVAIVTGAASGIGKGVARTLAADGLIIICADISDKAKDIAEEITASGGSADSALMDVADEESVNSAVSGVDEKYQRIDVLVNCAGIRPTKPFREMRFEDWDRVIKVNLYGTYFCCAAVLPVMERNQWGRVINISSLAAQQGSTGGHSHYSAAKAGITGLSKSLAREYASAGITVNVLIPGWIDTPGWGGELDGKRDQYAQRVPLGRLGEPADVANAVSFLVSEKASYLTGVSLPINGGLYIS